MKSLSRVRLLATPWSAAHQAPLSMGFSRQEYWSGSPVPSLVSCSVASYSASPWTVACQTPLSMGFPRQEYWSRLPFPPPNDLPNPGVNPVSPASSALAGRFFTTEPPGKPQIRIVGHFYYLLSFIFLFPLEFSCVLSIYLFSVSLT